MKTVLITGSNGFIGKNLIEGLKRANSVTIETFDIDDTIGSLVDKLKKADFLFHLAGINRPENPDEFIEGNVGLTKSIVSILKKIKKKIPVVFSSSIQAVLENPYGLSKREAEKVLKDYSRETGSDVYVYRLPNVFGKWSRPNYNSVVATFCYNISHDLDITISDKDKVVELVYIDDIVNEFLKMLFSDKKYVSKEFCTIEKTFLITLGELAQKIYRIKDIRNTMIIPDLSDELTRCLHATYLSYLEKDAFSYKLEIKKDERGCLAELIKSDYSGQIFVSTSYKGVVRGNHYHNTKIEKFCVLKGEAVIKFRHIFDQEIISYFVSGDCLEIVDIPPGYTHSIENLSDGEMIVLFWANQIFSSTDPDTYFCEV